MRARRQAFLAALLASTSLGCPGYRRPPPEALAAAALQEAEEAGAAKEAPAPKRPPQERLKELQSELKGLLSAREALGKSPAQGALEALELRLKASETRTFNLRQELQPAGSDAEEEESEDPLLIALDELREELAFLTG